MTHAASSIVSILCSLAPALLVLVWPSRVRGRTVDHDDDGGREHDRRGHPSQTMDTYSHVMPDMGDVAADAIEAALS
jgi:hypothetical protein